MSIKFKKFKHLLIRALRESEQVQDLIRGIVAVEADGPTVGFYMGNREDTSHLEAESVIKQHTGWDETTLGFHLRKP